MFCRTSVLTEGEDPLHVILLGHAQHGQHGGEDGAEEGHHAVDCGVEHGGSHMTLAAVSALN